MEKCIIKNNSETSFYEVKLYLSIDEMIDLINTLSFHPGSSNLLDAFNEAENKSGLNIFKKQIKDPII